MFVSCSVLTLKSSHTKFSKIKSYKANKFRICFIQEQTIFKEKNHNKYSTLLYGLMFPGGGQFLIRDYDQGKGVVATFGLLMLMARWAESEEWESKSGRFYISETSSFPVNNLKKGLNKQGSIPAELNFSFSSNSYPPLILGFSVLISSALSSFNKTMVKNSIFMDYYLNEQLNINPPSDFMDFYEPVLLEIN